MIEQTILEYLEHELSVPVFVMQPEDPPASYVILEKTGGGNENHIPSSTIAIQSYGASVYEASALNDDVKTAMENILELDEITRCHLDTDYSFTDISRKKPRYQAVFDITHY